MCLVLTSAEASRCENISSLSLFFLLSSFSSFSPLRVFTSRLSNRLRHERKKGKKGERNVVERGEIENSIGFDRIPAVERVRLFSPMNPYLREQRTDQAILVNSTFTYALSNRVEIVAKLVNTPLTRRSNSLVTLGIVEWPLTALVPSNDEIFVVLSVLIVTTFNYFKLIPSIYESGSYSFPWRDSTARYLKYRLKLA